MYSDSVGITAFGIRNAVDYLADIKFKAVERCKSVIALSHLADMSKGHHSVSFILYLLINTCYAVGACLMVYFCGVRDSAPYTHRLQPLVAGSGISEVKGYLNGVRIVGLINLKTFIGKILSITLAYSSCLALGPGTVHLLFQSTESVFRGPNGPHWQHDWRWPFSCKE